MLGLGYGSRGYVAQDHSIDSEDTFRQSIATFMPGKKMGMASLVTEDYDQSLGALWSPIPLHYAWPALLLVTFAFLPQPAVAQPSSGEPLSTTPVLLSVEKVVANLVRMNSQRAQALRSYQGLRTYRVEYRGFPSSRSAEMVVAITYHAPGTKEFTIESATGSKLIINKVFKKALQSEKEALETENQERTALNNDNYIFRMVGYEALSGNPRYVLAVEPRTNSKFLYRGSIWVDAADFAVTRIEAQPAKNPSFWIKNTEIEQIYSKVNNFWLPAHNHSVTAIRLGGHADFTIDYGSYQITDAAQLNDSSNDRVKSQR